MKLIVGLGNPGKKYEKTRHNAGWLFVDALISRPELAPVIDTQEFKKEKKWQAEIIEFEHHGEKIIVIKPQTMMNLSGVAVKKVADYYHIATEDIIVVSDDVDLPLGTVRIRFGGTNGGHKGIQNIINNIGMDFYRLRLGIQFRQKEHSPLATEEYVLEEFSLREQKILDDEVLMALDYLIAYLSSDKPLECHTTELPMVVK